MATAELPQLVRDEQRLVLHAVDWPTYRAIADAVGERHMRFAYDGSNLEFMTVGYRHHCLSRLTGRLIVVLTEELNLELASAGSTTLEREDVGRGIEPDECFYLDNEPAIRNRTEIDLTTDPPPDLGVEIDVSRSSLDRLAIYSELRIPEVWRCTAASACESTDGERLADMTKLSEVGISRNSTRPTWRRSWRGQTKWTRTAWSGSFGTGCGRRSPTAHDS